MLRSFAKRRTIAQHDRKWLLFPKSHVKRDVIVRHAHFLDLEVLGHSTDEGGELAIAVGARVKTGVELAQVVSQRAEESPAILLHCQVEGFVQHGHRVGCGGFLCFRSFLGRPAAARNILFRQQVFGIDEHLAGIDESARRVFLADAHHEKAFFTDAGGEAGVIAVAGDQAEAIHAAGVQDIHGVDDHGAVGGVLADGVAELLDGLDGVRLQRILPAAHVGGGPVAVDAADGCQPVFADLCQHFIDQRRLGVIAIDQHGDTPCTDRSCNII